MASGATGTPSTNLLIPKINPSVDIPDGSGINSIVDYIDTMTGFVTKPVGLASGEVAVWNGAAFVRSTVTNVGPTSLGSGTPDATKFLRGDGSWQVPAAPTQAMVQLYDNVASGAIASWDVSSLSSSYNHIKIILQTRGDTAAFQINNLIRFNNDSGANYDTQYATDSTATVSAAESLAQTRGFAGNSTAATGGAGQSGVCEILIPAYKETVFQKTAIWRSANNWATASTNYRNDNGAFVWRSTAAINRITVFPNAGNYILGSHISIYGIL